MPPVLWLMFISLLGLTYASDLVGCFSYPEVLKGQIGALQPGIIPVDCLANCVREGKTFTYEYAQYRNSLGYDQWCLCSDDAPDYRYLSSGPDTCDPGFSTPGDVTVSAPLAPFTFDACYPGIGSADVGHQISDLFQCLSSCASYKYARLAFHADGEGGYCHCYLADELWSGDHYVPCNRGAWYIYQQTIQPSSFAKRGLAGMSIRKNDQFCPDGLTACNLPLASTEGYECIDINIDPESCLDCTNIHNPIINTITCVRGQCMIGSCEDGFALHEGICDAV
ncbi:hypothetical protein V866_008552 [Kwoniella sp. B9012]